MRMPLLLEQNTETLTNYVWYMDVLVHREAVCHSIIMRMTLPVMLYWKEIEGKDSLLKSHRKELSKTFSWLPVTASGLEAEIVTPLRPAASNINLDEELWRWRKCCSARLRKKGHDISITLKWEKVNGKRQLFRINSESPHQRQKLQVVNNKNICQGNLENRQTKGAN